MEIIKCKTEEQQKLAESIRYEMLLVVNNLPADYAFDKKFQEETRRFLKKKTQTTVLAMDGEQAIGCATICYIKIMPTFDHPTGKRAHIMNVYTNPKYRRQKIACKMMELLIDEAREQGATEISLDATQAGRFLYKKMGFHDNGEGMVYNLK